MPSYIPGSDSLGYGFDVFGTYSEDSKTSPLFDMVFDDTTWENYLVPENTGLDTSSKHYGETNAFSSRQKVEEHFGSKLSVKGSYGFFSAQFSASFNMTNKSDVSYQYALVEAYSKQYSLSLKNKSESALASWVKTDPDYLNIPDTFTNENRDKFFTFFDKYGTLFISEVVLGSRLYYSASVSKSYNYSEKDVEAKMKAEYGAVFSVSASAEANWKKAGEDWATRRDVKVSATGGDNSILNILSPGYGVNHENAFKAWLESAKLMPAVIDFKLTSVAHLFSGNKAKAVQQALDAYFLHKIYIESKTGTCLINFNGKAVLPQPTGEYDNYGFQLAAINRKTLKVDFQKGYSAYDLWSGYDAIYTKMTNDITAYNNDNYIIAFTTYSTFALTAPNSGFVQFLENCGADEGIKRWLDTKEANSDIFSCCALAHNNYVMVGIPGSEKGSAYEDYTRAGSCDTGTPKWRPGDGWLAKPAAMASTIVDIYELQDDNSDQLVAHLATKY